MATIGIRGICLAAIALCVTVGHAIFNAADRFIGFIFASVSPAPQLALVAGPQGYADLSSRYETPRVDRHEAHTSRRAAARHI